MSFTNGTPRATTPRSIRRDREALDLIATSSAPARRGVFVQAARPSTRLTAARACGHLLVQGMNDVIASEREAIHANDTGLDCFVAEPVIGRAFARPVGSSQLRKWGQPCDEKPPHRHIRHPRRSRR